MAANTTAPDHRHSDRYDLAIAGASFTGLALAGAVHQAFAGDGRIAVVAPAPMAERRTDVRASALSASSTGLLAALGIWPDIEPFAEPVTRVEITDSALDDAIRPVLLAYDNRTAAGMPATFIVENHVLSAALLAMVRRAGAAITLIDGEVQSLTSGHGAATVGLTDGRTLDASLVVAADGKRSSLREAAGIKTIGWSYAQTGIVTTVAHELPHHGRAVQHFLPAGPFAILPLKGNRSCITWSEESAGAKKILALDDQAFLHEVDRRFGGKLGAIRLEGSRQSWPLDMHLARNLVADRLALIGDAAHGVHPIAGQGLNLGFRDVAALAEVIADAARLGLDFGHPTVLERYQRWRRLDSAMSTLAFDALNRLFSVDGTVLRTVRGSGLGLVDRLPALKRFFVAEAAGMTGEIPRLLRGEPA